MRSSGLRQYTAEDEVRVTAGEVTSLNKDGAVEATKVFYEIDFTCHYAPSVIIKSLDVC